MLDAHEVNRNVHRMGIIRRSNVVDKSVIDTTKFSVVITHFSSTEEDGTRGQRSDVSFGIRAERCVQI